MRTTITTLTTLLMLSWLGIAIGGDDAQAKLSAAAAKAIATTYPHARILEIDQEEEESVLKYEVTLTDGASEWVVELAADGTRCEEEHTVAEDTVPALVRHAAKAKVGTGTLHRITRLDVYAVAVEGQVAPLAKTQVSYEYRYDLDGQTHETSFASDGHLVKSELADNDDDDDNDKGHADHDADDHQEHDND